MGVAPTNAVATDDVMAGGGGSGNRLRSADGVAADGVATGGVAQGEGRGHRRDGRSRTGRRRCDAKARGGGA